jgi:hypothetical protein
MNETRGTCSVCGSAVRVLSSTEGTHAYAPLVLDAQLRDVTAERDAAQRELERTTRTLEAYQRGGVRDLHRQDHLDRALGWAVAIIAKAHRKTNFDAFGDDVDGTDEVEVRRWLEARAALSREGREE